MTRTSPRKWTVFSVLLALLLLDGLGILLRPAPLPAAAPPAARRIALYRPPPLPPKRPKPPRPRPKPPGPKARKRTAAAPAKRARAPKRARPAHTAPPGTGAPLLSLVRTVTPARKTPPAPIVSVVQGNVTLPAAPLSAPSSVTTADVPQFSPTAGAGGVASGPGQGGADAGAGAGGGAGRGGGGGGGAGGEPFGAGAGGGGGGGPRHVVYVLDISGSMTSRIDRARAELLAALNGLGEDESFDLCAFSDDVQPFDRALSPATPTALSQARRYLYSLRVDGGTNLDAALTFALSVPGVNEVFVITDGDPTEGETDWDALSRRVRRLNTAHARIDTVGLVGRDPEGRDRTFEGTRLLSRLSADSGGQFRRVSLGVAE